MKSHLDKFLKRSLSGLILFGVGSVAVCYGGSPANVATPASKIVYEQVAPFVQMGAAWGDRSSGSHGTFGEFPGGASSPQHSHSGAYHAVVVSGVMINPFEGEQNPVELGPGSYWFVPAGVEHVTACVSAEPCKFYFHADGAFDFSPVE